MSEVRELVAAEMDNVDRVVAEFPSSDSLANLLPKRSKRFERPPILLQMCQAKPHNRLTFERQPQTHLHG